MKIIWINKEFIFSDKVNQEIAATIGFFDGVHCGHRYLIAQLKEIASRAGLPSAVITFPIHPRKVLQADFQPQLLNSFEGKIAQLATTGIDYCFVLDFSRELADLTAEEFIREILRKKFLVKSLVVGYDHRFGKGRTNDFSDYKLYGNACGMDVVLAKQLEETDIRISSTAIRKFLAEGRVEQASKILSYNYTLKGKVISGNKIGRTLGFPTANLEVTETYKVIPASGVYATFVYLNDKPYRAMTYIGERPTILPAGERRIETCIFDFSGDIYGSPLKIEFIKYIRGDKKFTSMDELIAQLHEDKVSVEKVLLSDPAENRD